MTEKVQGRLASNEEAQAFHQQQAALQVIFNDRQTRQVALDMALRYFPAKSAAQLVASAGEFEKFLKGEHV